MFLFNNVGNEMICKFVDNFSKDDMSEETWRHLSNRLKQTVSNRQENRPERYWCKEFLPKGDDNFDGTIKFLVDESNGDISEKVVLTALANQHLCKCVTQYNANDYYSSNNSENSWICFDFKDKRIIPSNYQIKSYDDGTPSDYPKSWIIEGLNENGEWENLSTVNDCSYLNGRCLSHIFAVTNPNQIRMTHKGKNWWSNKILQINCFELYGKFYYQ